MGGERKDSAKKDRTILFCIFVLEVGRPTEKLPSTYLKMYVTAVQFA